MYQVRRFEGKNAIVTGASSGMGRATADRLAQEGAGVFLVARRREKLEETANRIRRAGGTAFTCVADVSEAEDVARFVAEALVAFRGKIDVLISNAGVLKSTPFFDITESEWDWMLDTNLKGMFLVGQAVAKEMARTGGGAIVNTSSMDGIVAEEFPGVAHYVASKGGVSLLTRQMAIELAPKNIRVNAVCPGFIDTPMNAVVDVERDDPAMYHAMVDVKIPMRRAGSAGEVAAAMAFLASQDASYITGELLLVDGGMLAS
jgi:3-oxoacyl-[acyl-carrier protein] reductase